MPERLLLGNQFDVILARVRDELPDFRWRERAAFGANEGMRHARERVLHIKGVHVQLEVSFGANLLLDVIHCRNWAAADVVRTTAPAHSWPVHDFYSWNEHVGAFASHELFQC